MPSKFMRSLPEKAKRLFHITFDTKPQDDIEEDGGPGSGNWGHKGRPGLVGGSGKGGGKQYRGGRGDIMYTSSRRDWLNGLRGERQHEAQTWMKEMHERFSTGEDDKRSADQMLMQEGSPTERRRLLEFMGEARGWDQHAGRLMNENLDDQEKKLVETLANKYGLAYTGGSMVPDEQGIRDWDEEDVRTWYDLKSKAMGGQTSGLEPPDELLYEAGLKERPAPPKPAWPKTAEENDDWYDSLSSEKKQYLAGILHGLRISPDGFMGTDINGAEYRILAKISRGDEAALWEGRRYLDFKDGTLGGQFMKTMDAVASPDNTEGIGNLDFRQTTVLSSFMQDLLNEQNARNDGFTQTVSQVGDLLESDFLHDPAVPRAAKTSYMVLKSAALGTAITKSEIEDARGQLQQYRIQRNEERKAAERLKTRDGREEAYHPASVAGVQRRDKGDMSFDEADNHRANPDFANRKECRINCQTCVIAHEMRLRGYDVEAKPYGGDAYQMQHRVASAHSGSSAAWINLETGKPALTRTAIQEGATTKQRTIKWFERTVKPGERYHLSFCWKRSGAHIVTLQRDEKGSLMIYDPQSDRKTNDLLTYLSDVKFTARSGGSWPLQIVRVDNAVPVQNVIDSILKPARSY